MVDFKREYIAEINKKIQDTKQRAFQESEQEKESLRAEERKKLKESYEKLQR